MNFRVCDQIQMQYNTERSRERQASKFTTSLNAFY